MGSGILFLAAGASCVVAPFVQVALLRAELAATGRNQGTVPLMMPLMFGGLLLIGAGVHRILWSPPRGENLSRGARQVVSAAIAVGSVMVLSFLMGILIAISGAGRS